MGPDDEPKNEHEKVPLPKWFDYTSFKEGIEALLEQRDVELQIEEQDFKPIRTYEEVLYIDSRDNLRMLLASERVITNATKDSFEEFRLEVIRLIFNCINTDLLPEEWDHFVSETRTINKAITSRNKDIQDFIPNLIGEFYTTVFHYVIMQREQLGESFEYSETFEHDPQELDALLLQDL